MTFRQFLFGLLKSKYNGNLEDLQSDALTIIVYKNNFRNKNSIYNEFLEALYFEDNDTYFHDWKVLGWKLEADQYLVKLEQPK